MDLDGPAVDSQLGIDDELSNPSSDRESLPEETEPDDIPEEEEDELQDGLLTDEHLMQILE